LAYVKSEQNYIQQSNHLDSDKEPRIFKVMETSHGNIMVVSKNPSPLPMKGNKQSKSSGNRKARDPI